MAENKESYSYSKMDTFLNCPRKFQFVYKLKFPRSQNVATLKGTLLHSMIELYIKDQNYDIPYEGNYLKLPKSEFDSFKIEFKEKIIKQEIIQQLKQICSKVELLEVEKKLSNIFNTFSFTGYADTFVKNNKNAIIIDYKTGKVYEKFNQLKYYALISSYLYPEIENFKLILSFTTYNEKLELVVKKEELKEIELDLINKIKNLEECDFYKKSATKLCDYCEYKTECLMKDQIDLVYTNILESKYHLPGKINGPLVWDGYIKSNVTLINEKPNKSDLDNNKILSGYDGLLISNILDDYDIKLHELFILNYQYYLDNEYNDLNKNIRNINLNQFHNILNIVKSKNIIIFGEKLYKEITNRDDFEHNKKIVFENKNIYMFYDTNYIINNFEKSFTYNLIKEIKELLS